MGLRARRTDRVLGTGAHDDDEWDETDRAVVRWICAQEHTYRFILYEADATWTAWTRRCVQMADRLLVVARADGDPSLSSGERGASAYTAHDLVPSELVLIHDDDAPLPSGTARWLADRPQLVRVHHVKLGAPATLRRLVRFLSGRAVGVVLGGGARNAAQIGAVQALRDVGIPVDLVGGSSAGAGDAAMVALGQDLQTMAGQNRRAFVGMAPFRHFSFPHYSMIRRTRVEEVARFLYGDTRIEDLWIGFFCLSADLVAGKPVLHREGEVWRAVLATTALPGVLPPVWWDGRLLVDGGVFDNNPVTQMRALRGAHRDDRRVARDGALRGSAGAREVAGERHGPVAPVQAVRKSGPRADHPGDRRPDDDARPARPRRGESERLLRPAGGLTDFESQDVLLAIGYDAVMAAIERRADDPVFLERFGLVAEAVRTLPRLATRPTEPDR